MSTTATHPQPRTSFGTHFSDHMFVADWSAGAGWQDPRVVPYGPLALDPASSVFHYGQEIFEGLKAYAHADGSIKTFRPYANAARMRRSAGRVALPTVSDDMFVGAIDALVRADAAWVPTDAESSLYVRPFMFATEAFVGVRSARRATFAVIASPAGSYFSGGVAPVDVWLSQDYSRAGSGGTGGAKTGGNYAASTLPQAQAVANGCEQVVFVDDAERGWVEEVGAMNLYFVYDDGSIVTPASDSILAGITRDSLNTLAAEMGHEVSERPIAIDEWREGVRTGRITEVFACGTAAVVSPIGSLVWADGEGTARAAVGAPEDAPVTFALREALTDIQYGRARDSHGWMHSVVRGHEPIAAGKAIR